MREDSQSRSIESLAKMAVSDFRFDYNQDKPAEREYLLSIVEGEDQEYEVGLVSNGGIVEVIGKKGSRKTTFLSMIVASCFSPNGIFGNIKSNIAERTVLWFDTEMTGDDFWYFQKKLHEQCGLQDNHPRLQPINMDFFSSSKEKLDVILHILKNSNNEDGDGYYQDIGLIVIDGIADLISDTGNEAECRQILDEIKSVLNSMDTCLVTVLHSDKKGQHSRGTLGTLLDQKATAAVMMDMKITGDPTTVRCEKNRNGRNFHPYRLEHDYDGSLLINGSKDGSTFEVTSADFMDKKVEKEDEENYGF